MTREHDPLQSDRPNDVLSLVAEGVRPRRVEESAASFNARLRAAGHWHIELLPQFTTMASIALGAGYHINTLAPEFPAGLLLGT